MDHHSTHLSCSLRCSNFRCSRLANQHECLLGKNIFWISHLCTHLLDNLPIYVYSASHIYPKGSWQVTWIFFSQDIFFEDPGKQVDDNFHQLYPQNQPQLPKKMVHYVFQDAFFFSILTRNLRIKCRYLLPLPGSVWVSGSMWAMEKRAPGCLFRLKVGMKYYQVMWGLFHKPWNRILFNKTRIKWWKVRRFLGCGSCKFRVHLTADGWRLQWWSPWTVKQTPYWSPRRTALTSVLEMGGLKKKLGCHTNCV